jgi:uncharacterized membrane protein required for colicin V production
LLALFLALGARMGSVWSVACLAGGFLGSFFADSYGIAARAYIGHFPGSPWVAGALLYAAGLLLALVPGFLLRSLTSALFLGVVDGICGLATGAIAFFFTVVLFILLVLPRYPSLESSQAWKKSKMIPPLRTGVDKLFPGRRRNFFS